MKMRLYYIAYDYGQYLDIQMIDGPFGTASEAIQERSRMIGVGADDTRLIVVRKVLEMEKVDI
jgi:hypothetical protein